MFKITPVQSAELCEKYASICSVKLRGGAFMYAMTDCKDGHLMGIAQFELDSELGYIYDIKEAPGLSDFEAMFILARQTMNFINGCGIEICRAELSAAEPSFMAAVGFSKSDSYFECSLKGMFDGNCKGHKK